MVCPTDTPGAKLHITNLLKKNGDPERSISGSMENKSKLDAIQEAERESVYINLPSNGNQTVDMLNRCPIILSNRYSMQRH